MLEMLQEEEHFPCVMKGKQRLREVLCLTQRHTGVSCRTEIWTQVHSPHPWPTGLMVVLDSPASLSGQVHEAPEVGLLATSSSLPPC